jgi:hypothetical protein
MCRPKKVQEKGEGLLTQRLTIVRPNEWSSESLIGKPSTAMIAVGPKGAMRLDRGATGRQRWLQKTPGGVPGMRQKVVGYALA